MHTHPLSFMKKKKKKPQNIYTPLQRGKKSRVVRLFNLGYARRGEREGVPSLNLPARIMYERRERRREEFLGKKRSGLGPLRQVGKDLGERYNSEQFPREVGGTSGLEGAKRTGTTPWIRFKFGLAAKSAACVSEALYYELLSLPSENDRSPSPWGIFVA